VKIKREPAICPYRGCRPSVYLADTGTKIRLLFIFSTYQTGGYFPHAVGKKGRNYVNF
jgi:hypothetical protein